MLSCHHLPTRRVLHHHLKLLPVVKHSDSEIQTLIDQFLETSTTDSLGNLSNTCKHQPRLFNRATLNLFISVAGKCSDYSVLGRILPKFREFGLTPNMATFHAILGLLSALKRHNECFETLELMSRQFSLTPDDYHYATAIKSLTLSTLPQYLPVILKSTTLSTKIILTLASVVSRENKSLTVTTTGTATTTGSTTASITQIMRGGDDDLQSYPKDEEEREKHVILASLAEYLENASYPHARELLTKVLSSQKPPEHV
eukprot:TRINITY_DN3275_c0_g1_i4.p2 TRINITY_DN3275_c0_g1~~TRINITY_DN3275_c0_g1_i4.p2  ORF type:complete len:258 (+),score=65.39 TRINITY_DN3275_c0_g1_i4:1175-1948(+)